MARSKRKPPVALTEAGPLFGETWWTGLSSAMKHGIAIGSLFIVALIFCWPVLFSSGSLIGGDTVNWRSMAEWVIEHREETGEQALWAPNAFGGMPSYMISYVLEVPQVDRIVVHLDRMVRPLAHLFTMLAGAYLLAFVLIRIHWASVLAAVTYGFTTYMPVILVAGHNSKFNALAMAPWLVLAFVYVLRRPAILSSLLFAMALAVNLRAGHVQITYYAAFLILIWWISEGITSVRGGQAKSFALSTGWLVVGSVLAVLMVAQPYMANAEYRAFTIRGAAAGGGEGGLAFDYAMAWSQGWGELVTLLIADAYGGGGATYWGPKTFTAGPHYVGGIVILFAIIALVRKRNVTVWALAISVLVMTLFSLGEHLEPLSRFAFNVIPLFDAFRVPETWLSVMVLALAVLAAIGLSELGSKEEPRRGQAAEKPIALWATAGMLAFVIVLMLGRDVFFDFEQEGEFEQLAAQVASQRPDLSIDDPQVQSFLRGQMAEWRAERVDMFQGDAMRTLVFLVLAGLIVLAVRKRKVAPWIGQAAIVLLVVIDLTGVGRRHLNADVLVPVDQPQDLIATYDFDRFLIERREAEGGPGHFRILSLEGGNPTTNARPSFHHESIGGYHGAKLRYYQDYLDNVLFDPESGRLNLQGINIMNTRYVIAAGAIPGMSAVYRDDQTGISVYENPNALPRGFFVGQARVVEDDDEMWRLLRSGEVDLRETALLSSAAPIQTSPIEPGDVDVELIDFGPHEIRWRVQTDAPRLFVASEVYYPAGWLAFVDDTETPIHRVNHFLRGVEVREGEHELTMRFSPSTHTTSVWIAGVSTLLVYGGVIVLLGLGIRARRRDETEDEAAP